MTSRAAGHPGLTSRQCRRLLAGYRSDGPLAWTTDESAFNNDNLMSLREPLGITPPHFS